MTAISLPVPEKDQDKFVMIVLKEFGNLYEENAIGFGVRLPEFVVCQEKIK